MPRGVYKRKGQAASAVAPSVPKATQAASAAAARVLAAPVDAIVPADEPRQFTREDFRKPLDDMSEPLLKAFARHVGIQQRDVDNLSRDRLKQNIKAMQLAALED